jgi:hypothetical protein
LFVSALLGHLDGSRLCRVRALKGSDYLGRIILPFVEPLVNPERKAKMSHHVDTAERTLKGSLGQWTTTMRDAIHHTRTASYIAPATEQIFEGHNIQRAHAVRVLTLNDRRGKRQHIRLVFMK